MSLRINEMLERKKKKNEREKRFRRKMKKHDD